RCGGEGRNAPELRDDAVVRHSKSLADALRCRYRELTPEDFAEIISLLFKRPQFQVHASAPPGHEGDLQLRGMHADAYSLHRAAAAQIECTSHAKEHDCLLHTRAVNAIDHFHGHIFDVWT